MTMTAPVVPDRALARAQAAARERLLNAVVREVGPAPRAPGPVHLPVGATGTTLVAGLRRWSASGHHRWADGIVVEGGGARRPVDHEEAVALLLAIVETAVDSAVDTAVDTAVDRRSALGRQIAVSVERTARYLGAPARPEPDDAHGRTRHAEQSLRFGHPFHPTPKSLEGSGPRPLETTDLDRISPELGASFRMHHLAVDPAIAVGDVVGSGPWIPDDVAAAVPVGRVALPVHPLQAAYLRAQPEVARLVADGTLVDLGPLGREVYATSSVRTVCDPGFPTVWKLPLHVRITNFVRTVPTEHARRAADASRIVLALRPTWSFPGFGVLAETGWRGVDPAVVGEGLAAELTVLFRENPFVTDPAAPRTVAALVEEGPHGLEPPLVGEVRRSGTDPVTWLRAYLRISLLPLLAIFGRHGMGFEAHLQNSLLHTEEGWPTRFWVRDMEGTHVSRDRRPFGLAADSPAVYDEVEAWQRLRYHAVVNHLATVVAVLGAHLCDGPDEERPLWRAVADALATATTDPATRSAAPYAADLLTAPTLPAKANLLSRFSGRGERPLYVDLPNPIREAAP